MKTQSISQKFFKTVQKFKRFNMHDSIFLIYMVILCILFLLLLFFPIIKITPVDGGNLTRVRLFSGNFVGTMVVVLISLIVLIGWNFSTKFKNLFLTYFGGKENDSLVNFLFLCILITVFLSINNTINIVYRNATSTILFTGRGKIVLVRLFLGIIFTLVSVIKGAQQTGKKTKIINVVDEEHSQMESTKEEIKKGLFDNDLVK